MALLISGAAQAAGLGRLTLLSALGQPLNAEVELTSVQPNATITARLASIETYQRHNLPYNAAFAGARITLEKRPTGQSYLKATSPRAVTEPFLELLIEINSEHGRVTRQYTVLLDPPGYGAAAGEISPPAAATPTLSAAPTPAVPVEKPLAVAAAPPQPAAAPPKPTAVPPKPAAAPPRRAAAPQSAPAAPSAQQYGPIKSGETLSSIARSVQPDGVSLEQVLVGIYRQNPDAFIRKNLNLVKSGKILQVPEASDLAAVPVRTAQQEVRLHVADFNAYRAKLADRAGGAPEGGGVASGRIGSRVAEAAAGEGPRDTVRLSRGEATGKGKDKAGANERLRALEEESISREKVLTQANDRIAQLEKTIKDMQRLADLKGSAAAPQAADKAAPKAPVPTAVVVTPPAPALKGATPPDAAKGPAPDAGGKGLAPEVAKAPTPEPPKETADATKAELPAPKAAAPAKAAPPPPPPAAPDKDLVDILFDEPLYLAAGGAVLLLGGLGYVVARRRRSAGTALQDSDDMVTIAPAAGGGRTTSAPLVMPAPSRLDEKPVPAPVEAAAPQVPKSAAGDNDLDFNMATRGVAPPAEQPVPVVPVTQAQPPRAAELPRVAEPPGLVEPPRAAPAPQRAADVLRAAQAKSVEPAVPDTRADTPAPTPPTAKPVVDTHTLDFNLDPLPVVGTPREVENRVSSEPPAVDFKLDLNSLDFDTPEKPRSEAPARDDHWYDVQQKFDLAKAYEEMGDKDGARNILREVTKEGDVEQQAQAKQLLDSLS